MSKIEVCDLCKKPIMKRWEDSAYRVTVKEMVHFYDGYAPWRGKRTIDMCKPCTKALIAVETPTKHINGGSDEKVQM